MGLIGKSFDDLIAALTISTYASPGALIILQQCFCHYINKCIFSARYGQKIILSSHKLCRCIKANGWVANLTMSLVHVIFDGRTSFFSCFIINSVYEYGAWNVTICSMESDGEGNHHLKRYIQLVNDDIFFGILIIYCLIAWASSILSLSRKMFLAANKAGNGLRSQHVL